MLIGRSRHLPFLWLICIARLIVAVLVCESLYGVDILDTDCHHALWDLSTESIRDDIWRLTRLPRRFSKNPSWLKRDRMPQGFSYQSCSVGIDILDPPPGIQQSPYIEGNWVDLWGQFLELVTRCVVPFGHGGAIEAYGFSFTIINPNTGLGRGICMAPNRGVPMNMGRCIAQRAEAIDRAQRTREANLEEGNYPAASRGSQTRPQQRVNWDSNILGETRSVSAPDPLPQRATISDPSATQLPISDSGEVQSPHEMSPSMGENVQPPVSRNPR